MAKIKVLLDFFCEGHPPPVCLRCSPGLFRHSRGAVSCHTSSMAANPHLALTKNSSPTTLANGRRVAQNRGVQGAAPPVASRTARNSRPSQRAKSPKRPKRHPQMAQSPANGHGPRRRPLRGWTAGTIWQLTSTNAPCRGRCPHRPAHRTIVQPPWGVGLRTIPPYTVLCRGVCSPVRIRSGTLDSDTWYRRDDVGIVPYEHGRTAPRGLWGVYVIEHGTT